MAIDYRQLSREAQALEDLAVKQGNKQLAREASRLMSLSRDIGIKQRAARRQNKAFRATKSWEGM